MKTLIFLLLLQSYAADGTKPAYSQDISLRATDEDSAVVKTAKPTRFLGGGLLLELEDEVPARPVRPQDISQLALNDDNAVVKVAKRMRNLGGGAMQLELEAPSETPRGAAQSAQQTPAPFVPNLSPTHTLAHTSHKDIEVLSLGTGGKLYIIKSSIGKIGEGSLGTVNVAYLESPADSFRKVALKRSKFEHFFAQRSISLVDAGAPLRKEMMYRELISEHERLIGTESPHIHTTLSGGSYIDFEGNLTIFSVSEILDDTIEVEDSPKVAKSLLLALKELVKKDIAHNDIKTGNVLRGVQGFCIIDFNVSSKYSSNSMNFLNDINGILNTLIHIGTDKTAMFEGAEKAFGTSVQNYQGKIPADLFEFLLEIEKISIVDEYKSSSEMEAIVETLLQHPYLRDVSLESTFSPVDIDWPEELKEHLVGKDGA